MRRVVHVYLTRDADRPSLAALYEDLAERMAAALAELQGKKTRDARTLDDLQGHAFHGNQWTGGINGPHKPTSTTQKSAKAGIHELLSSGHPFSKDELMKITGVKTEKLFSDYMAMLKNAKYAGPKGALQIEKNQEGLYFVALPNGQPAPAPDEDIPFKGAGGIMVGGPEPAAPIVKKQPAPKPKLPPHLAKVAAKLDAPGHTVTEVHVPGFTEPAPAPAEPPAPAASLTGLDALQAAHPGSMPKGEADKHYEAAVDYAYAELAQMSKAGIGGGILHEHLLKFKNAKATAMASWAKAVHGKAVEPKPQAVYKADLQLAEDAKVFSKAAALNNWKHNSAAEKAGNFPPKPQSTVSTTPTHVAPVADMGHPAPVDIMDYHDLVPASFKPIGEEDITSGKFGKGIGKFKSALHSKGAENAVKNKQSIEHALRARLKDSPNFQALSKRLGLAKEGTGSLEARLISTWAGSSGDHNHLSVSMQLAVRDAFGIPDGHIEKKALHSLQSLGHDEAKVISEGIQMLNSNIKPLSASEIPVAKAALMEFAHAQYHETQKLLKDMGLDHVYLARGMKIQANTHPGDGPAALKLQPASSFSTNYSTAKSFAGGGTVFITKVPRQQVLSTYVTGFGCTSEHEVVVLAHDKMRAYTVSSSAASGHVAAQEVLASKITAGKPAPAQPAPKPAAVASTSTKQHAVPFDLAAAKKAVVNAKSKAYKALKAAKAIPHPSKIAHAEKAAKEAQDAVAALNAMKGKK